MQMQSGGDLGLLRQLLNQGLDGLKGEEPNRVACCWVCRRLLLWCQYAELEGVDLAGLAHLLGDLGEPAGRMYQDAPARARAVATALQEVTVALAAAGGRPDDLPDSPAEVVIV
jgi:hypothetical protein